MEPCSPAACATKNPLPILQSSKIDEDCSKLMPRPILHLLRSAQVEETGPARIVASLARGLDRAEFQVHAWFFGEPGPLMQDLEAAGAITACVAWTGRLDDVVGAWRFWRSLRHHRFAIVDHHFGGRTIRQIIRSSSNARIVVHLHARLAEMDAGRDEPIAVGNADLVIAVSHAVANQVKNPKAIVVHSGVDLGEGAGTPDRGPRDSVVVGAACRLVDIKGLTDLIQAMALLSPEFPNLRLEIAGEGPELANLQGDASRLGITERIRFLGWRRDMSALYRSWDIFAMPSLTEAFPMASLEAMAQSLPIVATNVGGLPELVENGRTGYLVPPTDPEALAGRLRSLIVDADRRKEMGLAGYQRVRDNFTVDRMVAQTADLYLSLL
jgi:glycosyltransferase involved in cell wall biosynthesis